MKAASKVIGAPLRLLGLLPKKAKAPMVAKPATRDDARDSAELEGEIRKRRGGAADILTGSYGAEAGKTDKTTLG